MPTEAEREVLQRTLEQLMLASRGERLPIVERAARLLGCSVGTVYRNLRALQGTSTRKRRTDAGRSALSTSELRLIAGVLTSSANAKGQRMPMATALDMLRASGRVRADVSASTVSRQLHARSMHPDQLARPTPSTQLRSLHPNHVWQIDSTTGAYYYLPEGRLRWMPEDEFYKNKVQNLVRASTDLLTRYAATDHASAAFKVRYYLGGESARNLLDFATWAMWKQAESPMHGVPLVLMMDPGAANRGQAMRQFAARTGVQLIHHAAGAARVTGSVEKTHDLVRMHFETRLRFADPSAVSLDLLNVTIAAWAAAYCSQRVHTRHGRTRYAAWLQIAPEQLRTAASLEALRSAAMREPERRRVSNTLTVPFGGRTYDVATVPGVAVDMRVMVVENLFQAPAIDVLHTNPDTGERTWHTVEPMRTDAWGFRDGAPVIGEEFRRPAFSQVDHLRTELTREAYRKGGDLPTLAEATRARKAHAQAYAGVVDNMADVNAAVVPTYLPRAGTLLPAVQRKVEPALLNEVEACKLLRERLGAAYSAALYDQVCAWVAQSGLPGISAADVERIAEQAIQPSASRAAGGGAAP